ncbi:MAG: glycosyltransferase family 4 protein [Candidatus Delongbacteria bacterium]|jgi:glycosyltransferase involved in cell wall biosynthesis|nr:glycosyltransferase family 4 protein [Candidatus Delongbacteria bacterium]
MKVLWLSPIEIGGNVSIGSWVASLAKKIIEFENVELHIAFKSKNIILEKKEIGKLTTWSVPSKAFSKYKVFLSNIFRIDLDKNISKIFGKVVKQVNPDIIQVFGTESDLGTVMYETDIPLVFHIQSVYHVYDYKYFSGITINDIEKFSSIKSKLLFRKYTHQYHKKKLVVKREKDYYSKAKFFLGRTDWDKRCASILSPQAKYFHCDETIRKEFFDVKWNKKFDNSNINIVTIIGGAPYKGLETIIESMKLLESRSNYKITWRIIGLEEYHESVLICKRKYKNIISENLKFSGRIESAKDIANIMLNSDMYVHPSHIENSPNSICEAMVLGMPIIATATGGVFSLLEDNVSGLLIQDGDPWSMAGAVIELYRDRENALSISNNAHLVGIERHNAEKISRNLLKIYSEILNQNDTMM